MSRKRVFLIGVLVVLLAGLVAAPFLDPTGVLWGYLRCEPIFRGYPASCWVKFVREFKHSDYVPNGAVQAFADTGDAGAAVWLPFLHDPDEFMRFAAAKLLGGCGRPTPSAVSALTEGLHDDSPRVRIVAAQALSKIGADTADAVAALKEIIDDPDSSWTYSAASVLWAIDPGAGIAEFGWRELKSTALGFHVTMPGDVESHGQFQELPGAWVELTIYSAWYRGAMYQVCVGRYPDGFIQTRTDEEKVASLRAAAGPMMGGNIVQEKKVKHGNRTAWEPVVEVQGKGVIRQRMWWAGNRLYMAQVVSLNKAMTETRWADYFLDSFQSDDSPPDE
jgi:hypothetical protein